MDMRGMESAWIKNIDPDAIEAERLATKVKIKLPCKGSDVRVEDACQIGKGRIAFGKITKRGVRSVAGIIVGSAPSLTGGVASCNHASTVLKLGQQLTSGCRG